MDAQEQLETYLDREPPERRRETLRRFMQCVEEILQDYRATYESPFDALEAAVSDAQEYNSMYGDNVWSLLVDKYVVQELYRKTLN